MFWNKFYISIVAILFGALTIVFLTFPRTKYSVLEKRELTTFPEFDCDSLASGAYTASISQWFSDSEPYREELMSLGMIFNQLVRINMGKLSGETFVFHTAGKGGVQSTDMGEQAAHDMDELMGDGEINEFTNQTTNGMKSHTAAAGILILGEVPNVRAMMAYRGTGGGESYARTCNLYKKTFPDVNIYCMVIPTAIEYYCPENAKSCMSSQIHTIRNTHSHLASNVHPVDIYTTLGNHADEDIFLRTDHHWSPLGGYYAAEQFAKVAKVPFYGLDTYEERVIHGFVGSMYGYSHDIMVKQSPEDFYYYIPKDVTYKTTYIDYQIDKEYHVIGEGRLREGPFFYTYKDGSSSAYMTFMAGDAKLTHVHTDVNNGRRLILFKDSYGNAMAPYFIKSFEDVYVIDGRYFTFNIKTFVENNQITDILFANNIFMVYGGVSAYERFLTQPDHTLYGAPKAVSQQKKSDEKKILQDSSMSEVAIPIAEEHPVEDSSVSTDSIH